MLEQTDPSPVKSSRRLCFRVFNGRTATGRVVSRVRKLNPFFSALHHSTNSSRRRSVCVCTFQVVCMVRSTITVRGTHNSYSSECSTRATCEAACDAVNGDTSSDTDNDDDVTSCTCDNPTYVHRKHFFLRRTLNFHSTRICVHSAWKPIS